MLILSYITTSIVPYAIYYSDDLNFIFTFLPVRASTADDAEFSLECECRVLQILSTKERTNCLLELREFCQVQ